MSEFNYLKEKARMVKSIITTHFTYCCGGDCQKCPLNKEHNGYAMTCSGLETKYPEEAEAIVRKWAEEHPVKTRKTRKDVLLEKFPNAILNDNGYPAACARDLGLAQGCRSDDWCKGCWNIGVEE